MKYLFSLFLLFATVTAHSQCSEFDNLLKKGDNYLKGSKPNYQEAINAYTAAILACSDRAGEAKQRITRMVNEINKLKESAVEAEKKATEAQLKTQSALSATETAKKETEIALAQTNKLLSAFYFYDDKFAIACNAGNTGFSYYFIDKEGNIVEKLGKWDKLEQFGRTGFAKASLEWEEENEYLIDTNGNKYLLCTNAKNIKSNTNILWLSRQNLANISIPFETEIEKHNRETKEIKKQQQKIFENLETLGEWLFKGAIFTGYFYDTILKKAHNGAQWIDISRNNFERIPYDFFLQSEIRILDISKNKITNLTGIENLKNIVLLDASHNKIQDIPMQINQLKHIVTVDLGSNNLTTIPVALTKIEQLKQLDLSNNKLTILPNEFGNMNSLIAIEFSKNMIEELPSSFGNLQELISLNLCENKLRNLPQEIGNLKNLAWFDLCFNHIESLPAEISQLKNLEWLNLRGNPISDTEKERIRRLLPNCQIDF